MTIELPEFWNYNIDKTTGTIVNHECNCKLYSSNHFQTFSKKKKTDVILLHLNQVFSSKQPARIYLLSYIYYILYTSKFNLDDKHFYNTVIFKLYEFIKKEYFRIRCFAHEDMKMFKQILYLFTGNTICEYKQCSRSCCNMKSNYCSMHIRHMDTASRQLTELTNLPLDISKIIYEYSI
jgi:hypothetical protein